MQANLGPAPGLEYLWREKGNDAKQGDLKSYWTRMRMLEGVEEKGSEEGKTM